MKKYLLLGYLCILSTFHLIAQTTPPTLTAAAGATVDADIVITFTDDGTWAAAIQSISYRTNALTVTTDYVVDGGAGTITLKPAGGNSVLQTPGSGTVEITATNYNLASVSQSIAHGAAANIVITTQPTAPASNGASLGTQPAVKLQDQYNNDCTSDNTSTISAAAHDASWTLGGTSSLTVSSGSVSFTDLTASSSNPVTGAYLIFSSGSLTSVNSNTFTIPGTVPSLTAASNANVDSDFSISLGTDDSNWRAAITEIRYGTDVLPSAAYDKTQTGVVVLKPSQSAFLQSPATKNVTIVATNYPDASVSQSIAHGAAANIVITTQPTAPASNGASLGTQPAVKLQDQYNNDCTSDNTSTISAAAHDASWTLGGTSSLTVSSGSASYTDLTASSSNPVTGAYLIFSSGSLTSVNSNTFTIPGTAPSLTAASNANVDSDFSISLGTDDSNWRAAITEIRYGTDVLPSGAYDKTQTGVVVLKPSQSAFLQSPATKNITIVATNYPDASVSQSIAHGAAANLVITTQPTAPASNGASLGTQPAVKLQDQYNNDCTSDNSSQVDASATGNGSWTLGGSLPQTASSGVVNFSGLTASSTVAVSAATISFTLGSTTVESNSFAIGLNTPPVLTAALGATVDNVFEISYMDDVDWETNISSITFDGNTVSSGAYTVNSTTNKITFDPSADAVLQTAKTATIAISVNGYSDATVSQTIGHGAISKLAIATQPVAPANNGELFQTQPVVEVHDQYDNVCTSNSSLSITAAANATTWTLSGSLSGTASSGVLSYSDLAASSNTAVTGAYIAFSATGVSGVNSNTFDLGLNTPPGLTAASNATVDGVFTITFTDTQSWQSKISGITYNGNSVDAAAYDISVSNQISFDPSKSTVLQTAGTADLIISSDGFSDTPALSQSIGHGAPSSIYIATQPTAPSQNGGLLVTQPQIGSKDQYGNNCTGDNATSISVAKGDAGSWSLGGSPNQTLAGGLFTYTDLSASSSAAVTGAYLTFTSGSLAAVNSNTFDIPVNGTPTLSAASNATVDNDFSITFTDDATWRNNITEIQYDGNALPTTAYDRTLSGRITFSPAQSSLLQVSGSHVITIVSSAYSNAEVTQDVGHGQASSLFIATQPVGPAANGDALATQPVVQLQDQYGNVCDTDNTSSLSTSASGGSWTLGGTTSQTASAGVFTFTDLTAGSSTELTTATLTFSSFSVSDVVSNSFTIPALNTAPQLLASSTATVDGTFEIAFAANTNWQLAIDSIHYGGNLVDPAAYDKTQAEKIIFDPAKDADLQVAGTQNMDVYAKGYETASVSQEIKHGAASQMVIVLQPAAPAKNGEALATQPGVTLRDQYGNDCTSENTIEITASVGDTNNWTLGGTVTKTAANGSVSYTDLTASSSGPVTGAFINFSATNLSTVSSNTFDIPDLTASPTLTAASGATVDADFEISFTDDVDWRNNITEIKYGTNVLPTAAYDISIPGKIVLKPSQSVNLQTAANEYLYITSTSFLLDSVQQAIGHGVATGIVITTQPMGPNNNAGLLSTQPTVKLQDQYQNDCTNDNSTNINANASGGSWTLGGTASQMVTNGVVAYTDLTAGSTDMVSNATITFSGTGLTNTESASFLIPAPLIAPSLLASTTATVDSLFDVTFADSPDWQGNIDSISYGGNLLAVAAYDKTQAGKIVFDPSKDTDLQTAATKQLVVFAKGYQNASVDQQIQHGAPDSLIIETQPTAPLVNGGQLDLQPKISLLDQYNNSCDNENSYQVVVRRGDAGNWTLGGDTLQAVQNGVINYRKLSASSPMAVTGAFLRFSGNGILPVDSDPFDIPALKNPPNLNTQFDATVDADFALSYFDFDDSWRTSIQMITYQGDTLPAAAYTINTDNITFHVADEVLLQKAGTFSIVVKALGYSDASADQTVKHGAAAAMLIAQQPLAPPANGDLLAQQPVVQLQDQYANLCDSDTTSLITASRSDSGAWNLAGSVEQKVVNGVATYTDLSAYSLAPVTGATIQFESSGLSSVTADPFDIPDVAAPPVLTAASGATVDQSFNITFTEDSVWRTRINVVSVNDSVLVAAAYDITQAGILQLIPSASAFLQKSGNYQIIVESRGFAQDTVQQEIQHGLADTILISTQPKGPDTNGSLLAQQPEIKLADQYLNDCITDNQTLVKVEKQDAKAWILSGTTEVQSLEGKVAYTDLVATSEIAIDSAYLQFSFAKDTVISNLFTIPVPIIELIAADNATVDQEFSITASDNASWRDSISSIQFAGATLADTSYLVEAGSITFYPAKDSVLQIARTDTLVIVANGYADARVEQKIAHGVTTEMIALDQPIGPQNNGDTLTQQPKLQLRDQYQNNCITDNATQVLVDKYADPNDDNSGLWQLGGTKSITAIEGIVQFTNLTATSEDEVIGARLLFTSDALPNLVSDSFNVVRPPAPIITAAANSNVDEPFTVTFTENTSWRNQIFDIRYGIRSLEGMYDISVPGQITFDPETASILQKYGVDTMYVYSGKYDTTRFEQPIHHGKAKYLIVQKEPAPPINNGDVFIRQPKLKLQDQYRNFCDTDNESIVSVRKADSGEWTLGGTLTQTAVNGEVSYTDLTATSEMEVQGARLEFEGTGLISKMSSSFTIPAPKTNRAGEASANPELVCYGSKSNITLVAFDGDIQWQIYNELDDSYEDLSGENAELLVTQEIVKNERYRARVSKSGFSDQYSNVVSVSPMQPPVADFSYEIDYNQVQFTNLSENATSILWDFGDGIVSSEFEPSHSFVLDNANGTGYVVTLTASNDACPDSQKSQQIFITTGIDDLTAGKSLLVYPNPSRGQFFVDLGASQESGIIRIMNSAGKLVFTKEISKQFSNNRLEFDLKSLPGGIYFVIVQYPDKLMRSKLIITK